MTARSGAILAGTASAALAARRAGRCSGACDTEVWCRLPGDEIVRDPLWESTRAITIHAPPEGVWPWIVQMGFPAYRAGWYTPYSLDRLQWGITERSAEEIVPELQQLEVGERVPDSRDWSAFFTVVGHETERALVLLSTRHILKPMRSNVFTWAFVLRPTAEGSTRLLIRARGRMEPRFARIVLGPLIGLGDFLNASVMLRGSRARAERVPQPKLTTCLEAIMSSTLNRPVSNIVRMPPSGGADVASRASALRHLAWLAGGIAARPLLRRLRGCGRRAVRRLGPRHRPVPARDVRAAMALGRGLGLLFAGASALIVLGAEDSTARPGGIEFLAAIVWRGVVYGAADGLLLSAFPILVVFAAFRGSRLRGRRGGLAAVAALAMAASLTITATYHAGYSDVLSSKLRKPVTGDLVWSAPTLATLNPIGAPIAHAGLHAVASRS